MNANDPNVALLEIVAERLGDDLREELVFVGGAVAGLLDTDPAMPALHTWLGGLSRLQASLASAPSAR